MDILKKVVDYLRNVLSRQNKKKLMENTVIVIIAGIIIIVAGGAFLGKSDRKTTEQNIKDDERIEAVNREVPPENRGELEAEVESILSQIDGVGKVSVMVTYVSGKEIVPAYDIRKKDSETSEKDNAGGTRNISDFDYESKIVYEDLNNGDKKPVIIKDIQPVVKGVVVVAEGASDPGVKERISKAVQVLMDVPIHKIQVFERKR